MNCWDFGVLSPPFGVMIGIWDLNVGFGVNSWDFGVLSPPFGVNDWDLGSP